MPSSLSLSYPWTQAPLVANAPMRLIALASLAVAVSRAGGIGFLAAGTDVSDLKKELEKAASLIKESTIQGADDHVLPIGVGFINWGLDIDTAMAAFEEYLPAAVWFFAPRKTEDLWDWTQRIRMLSEGRTKIWIQVGNVLDALETARKCRPDVLVIQGSDAGGHGLAQGASVMSLLPEVFDALHEERLEGIPLIATGGIVEGRGMAACLVLGAHGVVLGTRYLASDEASIAKGYQDDVLRVRDGGRSTVRTKVYDVLRGTTGWPSRYNGRGIINKSYLDAQNGRSPDENKRLYDEALGKGDQGWGEEGRLTAYAGSAVGLVKEAKSAENITKEVRRDAVGILSKLSVLPLKL